MSVHGTCRVVPGTGWHVPCTAWHRAILAAMTQSSPSSSPFVQADLELLSTLLRDLSADSGTVHASAADGSLHLRCAIGIPAPVIEIVRVVPVGKGMAGLAAERRCAVNSCNLQQDTTGDVRPGARATGLAGSVAVPVLAADGRVLGVIGVATRAERTFTADDERAISHRGAAFFV
jgi:signal transduction protein with GAF and PtsI domain